MGEEGECAPLELAERTRETRLELDHQLAQLRVETAERGFEHLCEPGVRERRCLQRAWVALDGALEAELSSEVGEARDLQTRPEVELRSTERPQQRHHKEHPSDSWERGTDTREREEHQREPEQAPQPCPHHSSAHRSAPHAAHRWADESFQAGCLFQAALHGALPGAFCGGPPPEPVSLGDLETSDLVGYQAGSTVRGVGHVEDGPRSGASATSAVEGDRSAGANGERGDGEEARQQRERLEEEGRGTIQQCIWSCAGREVRELAEAEWLEETIREGDLRARGARAQLEGRERRDPA